MYLFLPVERTDNIISLHPKKKKKKNFEILHACRKRFSTILLIRATPYIDLISTTILAHQSLPHHLSRPPVSTAAGWFSQTAREPDRFSVSNRTFAPHSHRSPRPSLLKFKSRIKFLWFDDISFFFFSFFLVEMKKFGRKKREGILIEATTLKRNLPPPPRPR